MPFLLLLASLAKISFICLLPPSLFWSRHPWPLLRQIIGNCLLAEVMFLPSVPNWTCNYLWHANWLAIAEMPLVTLRLCCTCSCCCHKTMYFKTACRSSRNVSAQQFRVYEKWKVLCVPDRKSQADDDDADEEGDEKGTCSYSRRQRRQQGVLQLTEYVNDIIATWERKRERSSWGLPWGCFLATRKYVLHKSFHLSGQKFARLRLAASKSRFLC